MLRSFNFGNDYVTKLLQELDYELNYCHTIRPLYLLTIQLQFHVYIKR